MLRSTRLAVNHGVASTRVLATLTASVMLLVVAFAAWRLFDPSPATLVEKETLLPWPASGVVLDVERFVSGAFGSDYCRTISFKMSVGDAQKWLSQPPYGGGSKWNTGPISDAGVPLDTSGFPPGITENKNVSFAYHIKGNLYSLLVVDPVSGEAWLQDWCI